MALWGTGLGSTWGPKQTCSWNIRLLLLILQGSGSNQDVHMWWTLGQILVCRDKPFTIYRELKINPRVNSWEVCLPTPSSSCY